MNLDDLIGILDFVPAAVGLPAFGDDLNQDFAERRIGNVSDPFAIGLDVELGLLVLKELAFFDILHIDAGVLNGLMVFATSNFHGETIVALLARGFRFHGSGLGGLRASERRKGQKKRQRERSDEILFARSHDADSILPKNKGMGQVETHE